MEMGHFHLGHACCCVAVYGALQEMLCNVIGMDRLDVHARLQAQWRRLFAASGFHLVRIWPTRGTLKVVEAAAI